MCFVTYFIVLYHCTLLVFKNIEYKKMHVMYNIEKWYLLFLYSLHSVSTVQFTANSAFMNDFANKVFILSARTFVIMKFRKCKSANYICATETIITSTTGTGQKGGSSYFVQDHPYIQCVMQPLQALCHA